MNRTGFELGVVLKLEEEGPAAILGRVRALGFRTCHISVYEPALLTAETLRLLRAEASRHAVTIDGLWAGWPGHVAWDFVDGPATIGIVPAGLRRERVEIIMRAARFAADLGVPRVMTHLGFVPEVAADPVYVGLIPVLRELGRHCASLGQQLCFETGQETPITLLRTIEDVGLDNLGVNLDPANLLMYGKGNPVDAMDVLGPWIRGVHIKDGRYPTNGRELGIETPVGEGQVDFPRLLGKLAEHKYHGALCIETELAPDRRADEIDRAARRLKGWIAALGPQPAAP